MTIFGRNTVLEGLKSSYNSEKLFLQTGINEDKKISEIIQTANSKNIPIEYLERRTLSKVSKSEDHQGVALRIEFELQSFSAKKVDILAKSYILIPEATYEQNIGAIIRTAECAGLGGVILQNGLEITPTIIKVSTGAVFHIPVYKGSTFQIIKDFKKSGFDIVAIERGGTKLYNTSLENTSLFIIGGEDKSVSETLKKECNKIVEIPQYGKVNSLNMSVATAVVIYEHIRQLNFK
jgi:23S rRNA (guanosine2251-2'-O)-methyltransferase